MASRYGNQAASTDDIEQYIKNSIPINTTKQTNKWSVAYKQWAKLRNKEADIHTLPPFELFLPFDKVYQTFFSPYRSQLLVQKEWPLPFDMCTGFYARSWTNL